MEKLKRWHKIGAIIAAVAFAAFAGSFLFAAAYQICTPAYDGQAEQCAQHHLGPFILLWIIGEADAHNGLVTAIATVFVAGFTLTLWQTSKAQGDYTLEALKLARDEFNATHRPEIVVHSAMEAVSVMRGGRRGIGASVTYFNKGTSPAKNIEICAVIVPVQHGERPQDRIALPLVRERMPDLVVPGIPYSFNVWSEVEFHRGEPTGSDGSLPPEATVYCIGTASYDDSAGVRRQTGFSWRWEARSRRWESDYLSSYYYSY